MIIMMRFLVKECGNFINEGVFFVLKVEFGFKYKVEEGIKFLELKWFKKLDEKE